MANSSSAEESDQQHSDYNDDNNSDDDNSNVRNGNGKYYDDDEEEEDYSQNSAMKSEADDSFGSFANNNNNNNTTNNSSNNITNNNINCSTSSTSNNNHHNNNSSNRYNHHHSSYKEESDDEEETSFKKKKRKCSDSEEDYVPKKKSKKSKKDKQHESSSSSKSSSSKHHKKIKEENNYDDNENEVEMNDQASNDGYDSDYKSSSSKSKKLKNKSSNKQKHSDVSGDKKKSKHKTKSEKEDKIKKKKSKDGKKIKHEEPAETTTSSGSNATKEKGGKRKKIKEEEEEHIWKWWEEERPGEGIKWKTLEHNGPVFPPDYEPLPKYVKFYYNGKQMELSPDAEEVAGFYARMLDHDYTAKDIFNKNFFKDWRKTMNEKEKETITDLKLCNFKELHNYFKEQSEKRKQMSKEEKQEIKKKNEEIVLKYGYCIVDGHKQKIGNFRIEPPGLFRGRGEHPKMGRLKKRVQPEDIIINIGDKAKIPPPPSGHRWKEVRHDNTVTWLASWTENIMGNVKYIMLNPSSKLKSIKDWQKYEKARELKKYVAKFRADYRTDFKSREMMKRQRAVALYFIDKLALRAGNEKEEGETADTVGCCSLRVEHITLHEEKDGKQYVVDFDFLGKDSIRYYNSVSVEKRVFKNLKHFIQGKQPGDDLFDRLNTASMNKYLNSLMEGLTAKVFRTYNASNTLQQQLNELTKEGMNLPEKMLAYNRANRAVALLCNHQRAVPKTFDKQMENLNVKIKDKKTAIKEAKKLYKESKNDATAKEKYKKKLKTLEEQLKKLEVQKVDKEENKQIALSTSKLNYLDPRISVAWCKKWEVPIDKIYNKTQRDKFRWAIEMVGPDYQF